MMSRFSKAKVEPYQFEPTYPEGEQPELSDSSIDEEDDEESSDGRVRIGNSEWCLCGYCLPMSTELESICCQELDVLNEKFDESGVDCITEHHKFEIVCLDFDVLKTALVALHNARSIPQPETVENRSWRLSAYRQFTSWAHGYLGKRQRRPIPACVVIAIRKKFPEESGIYVGFKEFEINE